MDCLRRFFRKLGKGLKAKGYTLVEVAAVVAVTAGLTAVVLPIAVEKANDSKLVGAKQDCIKIGGAITGFYNDTGVWPAYSSTTRNYFEVLRSGPTNDTTRDPQAGTASDNTTVVPQNWGATKIDHLENHLVVDNPGGTFGETPNANYLDTFYLNWKGPYSGSLTKRDPWGNNYLAALNPMHTTRTGTVKEYGWIISAGPNGKLETRVLDNKLGGDDIGVMLYAAETGH